MLNKNKNLKIVKAEIEKIMNGMESAYISGDTKNLRNLSDLLEKQIRLYERLGITEYVKFTHSNEYVLKKDALKFYRSLNIQLIDMIENVQSLMTKYFAKGDLGAYRNTNITFEKLLMLQQHVSREYYRTQRMLNEYSLVIDCNRAKEDDKIVMSYMLIGKDQYDNKTIETFKISKNNTYKEFVDKIEEVIDEFGDSCIKNVIINTIGIGMAIYDELLSRRYNDGKFKEVKSLKRDMWRHVLADYQRNMIDGFYDTSIMLKGIENYSEAEKNDVIESLIVYYLHLEK